MSVPPFFSSARRTPPRPCCHFKGAEQPRQAPLIPSSGALIHAPFLMDCGKFPANHTGEGAEKERRRSAEGVEKGELSGSARPPFMDCYEAGIGAREPTLGSVFRGDALHEFERTACTE